MNGAIIITAFLAFIAWLIYLKNQNRKEYLQSKESYVKEILTRYPSSDSLEKLLQSGEWARLMEVYGKPPESNVRLLVLIIACLGILLLCVAGAATILAMNVDGDMIYPAIILSAIGLGLFINAAIINHYIKKWKL